MDLGRGVSTSVIVVPAAPDNHLAIDRPAKKGLKSLALDLPKSLGAVRSDLMQISKQDEGRRTLYIEKRGGCTGQRSEWAGGAMSNVEKQ